MSVNVQVSVVVRMLQVPVVEVVVLLTLSVPAIVCPDEKPARAITIRDIQMDLALRFESENKSCLQFIGHPPCSMSLLVWLQSHLEGIPHSCLRSYVHERLQPASNLLFSFIVFSIQPGSIRLAITNCALIV